MTKKVTVRREDISLQEQVDEVSYYFTLPTTQHTRWVATLDGYRSTGEHILMSRSSLHAGEALLELEEAIAENGWEIE